LTAREFIKRHLRPAGAVLVRKRGDHHIYRLPSGNVIAIPIGGKHREIRDGRLKAAMDAIREDAERRRTG
jgi:predicted RNA binding protein YcfA (HicA-like mRNA interferase family)